MVSLKTSSSIIVKYLHEAEFEAGDKLPAEIEMARELGLSRGSIREAYARLAAQGMLVRRHGVGTFLARPPIINDLGNGRTFWGMVQLSGAQPSLRELAQDAIEIDEVLAVQMGVAAGTVATHLRWLFCADQVPVVLIDHFLGPHIRIAGIDWQNSHNLLAALSDQIGGESAELETWSTAVNAAPPEATILDVKPGFAILYGSARVHDPSGRVPVVSRHWSNPKLFSIAHRQPITATQLQS